MENLVGNTDISVLSPTVTGAINVLNSNKISKTAIHNFALALNQNGSYQFNSGDVVYAAEDLDTGLDTFRIELMTLNGSMFTLKWGRIGLAYYIGKTKIWQK